MTLWGMDDFFLKKDFRAADAISKNVNAKNSLIPMGVTSEIVAERYGITREDADNFAFDSQKKAGEAQKKGLFKEEIAPIKVTVVDKQNDGTVTKKEVLVEEDDGIRPTSRESLTKLATVFKKEGGVSTAGNSSQV
jgi:acetyl-CoA acyltransferase 1